WIKKDQHLDENFMSNRNYRCVLAFDIFRATEAEWLSQAILKTCFSNELLAISYETGNIIDTTKLRATRDDIYTYVNDKNLYNSVIFNKAEQFFAFFAQYRDYYQLFGPAAFLENANPVPPETMKFQFFENVNLEAQRAPIDEGKLSELWDTYSSVMLGE
ncbi:MAG: hypothetical protein AAF850_00530, partial [Pseudomonadota bacterium]